MDMTWVTGRIAIGGGIWTDDQMDELVRMGVTHIIDMQIEFDDTEIARPYDVKVLWNPVDDDFSPSRPTYSAKAWSLRSRRWISRIQSCMSIAPLAYIVRR